MLKHEVLTMSDAKRSLNGVCEDLGDLVAKLCPDDEASIRAVKQGFAILEQTVARVSRSVNQLDLTIGSPKIPPDQVPR